MKVLNGIICLILSGEWLGDDDAYPVERAADPLHRPGIDSKPFGDDPYIRPSRSRQGLTDSFFECGGNWGASETFTLTPGPRQPFCADQKSSSARRDQTRLNSRRFLV